jgi:membrane-associated phospholipid phosphatase
LPFIIWTTDIFKYFARAEACCRPWNGNFSCEQRSHGGFPSTHGAQLAYAATLFGLQFGPKAAFPLGAYTAAIGLSAINGNRHYVAQYIAGVTLGMIYGFAASKTVDNKISKWSCSLDVDQRNNPALKVSCTF